MKARNLASDFEALVGTSRTRRKQFSRHLFPQRRAHYERFVKVFNNSVENRVEKARARIKTPRQHEAYSSLHKLCASGRFTRLVSKTFAVLCPWEEQNAVAESP
jgi:hypothetical protein